MSKTKLRLLLILGLTALVLSLSTTVMAQGPEPTPSDDEVNAIARQMYCPVCENTPLDVCATTACAQWREMIREKLSLGWSEDQIFDYFAEMYGDRVLAVPPSTGLNRLNTILPPVFLLIGIFILVRGFKTWLKPVESLDVEDTDPEEDSYISEIEEALKKRKE